MKLYSVSMRIALTEIGDAEPPEPKPKLADEVSSDSPIADVAKLFDHMQARGMLPGSIATPSAYPVLPIGYATDVDGMNMTHNFRVIINSFDEMQEILARFRKVADSIDAMAVK